MVNVYLRGQDSHTGKFSPRRYLLEKEVDGVHPLKWFTDGFGARTEIFEGGNIIGQELAAMASKERDHKLSIITKINPVEVAVHEDWPSDRPADTFSLTEGDHYILREQLGDFPPTNGAQVTDNFVGTLAGLWVAGDGFVLGHKAGTEGDANIKLSNVSILNDSVERLRVNQVDGDALDFEKTSLDDILSLIRGDGSGTREGEIELMIERYPRAPEPEPEPATPPAVPGPTTHRLPVPPLARVERWDQLIRAEPAKWAFIYDIVQRLHAEYRRWEEEGEHAPVGVFWSYSSWPEALERERLRLVQERDITLLSNAPIQQRQDIWIPANDAIAIVGDQGAMQLLVENHSDIDWSPTEGVLDRVRGVQGSVGGGGRKRKSKKRKSKKRKTRKRKRRTYRRR